MPVISFPAADRQTFQSPDSPARPVRRYARRLFAPACCRRPKPQSDGRPAASVSAGRRGLAYPHTSRYRAPAPGRRKKSVSMAYSRSVREAVSPKNDSSVGGEIPPSPTRCNERRLIRVCKMRMEGVITVNAISGICRAKTSWCYSRPRTMVCPGWRNCSALRATRILPSLCSSVLC